MADLASRGGFHSFLPYCTLLFGLKGDQGADLVFGSWLDFTRWT